MRKPPEISPQEVTVTPQKQDGIIRQMREYKLITPLFGGGVTAGEGDPVTLIRGTEIRGLLRFWWRACRGGNYKTIEEMKKKEDEIWGAACQVPKSLYTKIRVNKGESVGDVPRQTDWVSDSPDSREAALGCKS